MVSLVPNPNPVAPEKKLSPVGDLMKDKTKEFLTKFPPPSILLMGDAGTGKTTSIYTLLERGLKVFVLTTEPAGLQSLIDKILDKNVELLKNLHWHEVTPSAANWSALTKLGEMVTNKGYEEISKEKDGIAKRQTAGFNILVDATANFTCQRTGEIIGDVTEQGPGTVFVIDSLSGLSTICYQHTVGFKPSPHQGEWGTMMSILESYLNMVTQNRNCYFVLIAHMDVEPNELLGISSKMVATLGKKLAPKIPKMFTEVVLAKRDGDKFSWSTAEPNTILKTSVLPISRNLEPSFRLCVERYEKRMEAIKNSKLA